MTSLEVRQLQCSVPKCLQKRATHSESSIRCVWCSLGRPLQHTPGFPRLYISICVPDSFLQYHGSSLSCKLESARELTPLRVPTCQSIWQREPPSDCQPPHHTGALPGACYAEPYRGSPRDWTPDSCDCELKHRPRLSLYPGSAFLTVSPMLPGVTCQVNYLSPNPSSHGWLSGKAQLKCRMLCRGYGQAGDEGLSPLPPNSCWSTNPHMKTLGGGALGK